MHDPRHFLASWVLVSSGLLLATACQIVRRAPVTSGGQGDAGFEAALNRLRPCADLATCEACCDRGEAEQCLRAGTSYSTGQGASLDERRAVELLMRACDLGSAAACTFAGRMYEFEHGVPREAAKAHSLYERACESGDPSGCYNAAIMLANGRGTARNLVRAVALYRQVCAAGSTIACEAATRLGARLAADGGGS